MRATSNTIIVPDDIGRSSPLGPLITRLISPASSPMEDGLGSRSIFEANIAAWDMERELTSQVVQESTIIL
jgi:hypothetical protein